MRETLIKAFPESADKVSSSGPWPGLLILISALEGQPVGLERQVAGPGALGIAVIRYPVRAEKAFAPHVAKVRQIAAQPHDHAPGEVFCAFSGFRLIPPFGGRGNRLPLQGREPWGHFLPRLK